MPALILYLLKANVALVLFYLAYHLVLRKLTFYHLNRLFLVFGIVFSAAYPFIDLTELFSRHQELATMQDYAVVLPAWTPTAIPEQATFDYWLIPVGLFWLGCGLMLLRLVMQFVSLYRIHRASVPASYQGVDFRKVSGISEAFSFWKTIYLNPTQHRSPELESILRHEQIHVNGWHTLDVLLAELSTVFYWFNPGVWLMKKAMKENLEFIADQHVVDAGVDRKEYQYLLLKVVGATQPQIANQFNFPSLKRRIAMMNKMPTSRANRLRLLVVLPITAALIIGFNGTAKTLEQEHMQDAGFEKRVTEIQADNEEFSEVGPGIFVKNSPEIKSVCWTYPTTLAFKLQSGEEEIYELADEESFKEASSKYGVWLKNEPQDTSPVALQSQTAPPKQADTKQKVPDAELYYIDGMEVKKEAVAKLDPETIHSIQVYKGETAEKVFGKGAAKGVISIISKKNKDSRQVQEFNKKFPIPPAPPKPGTPPPPPAPEAPGTPPPPPAPNKEAIPPVPPAPTGEQLPPPPPPVKGDANEAYTYIIGVTDDYYKDAANLPEDHKAFLKRNPSVKQVGYIFNNRRDFELTSFVVYLKSGKTEVYDYNKNPRIPAAEAKYGQLPALPPPPPPVRKKSPDQKEEARSTIFKNDVNNQVGYNPFWNDTLKENAPNDYKEFRKRNPTVTNVSWILKGIPDYTNDNPEFNVTSIVLSFKSGKIEAYDYNGNKRIPAAEKKYGKLPQLPLPQSALSIKYI